jgi:iron(III) transport system ATP-binding protein
MSHLELSGVTKGYADQSVLTGVDLAVEPETMTAILGPSGSGKTTLLRLVAGFDRIDQGRITIGGDTMDDGRRFQPPERRRLGYVPQEGALFPHLTVAANVAFGLAHRRRQGARVGDLLEMVGLTGLERRYPDQLSGGQQQRVALARALATEPTLVLLDEPFSALDASLRASLRGEVRDILRQAGATTVLVTHDQDEALSLADQVAVLRDGRVVQHASPHDLYAHPIDAELARFLGDANLVEAVVTGSSATTDLGTLTLRGSSAAPPADGPAQVLVRPEQIEVAVDGSDGSDGSDRLGGAVGRVIGSEFHGHYTLVRIRLEGSSAVGGAGAPPVLARHEDLEPLAPGTMVRLTVRGPVTAWSTPGQPSGA